MEEKFKYIICPDYGKLKIHKFFENNGLKIFFRTYEDDLETAVDILILKVISDVINIELFTSKDKCEILREVASQLRVKDKFENNIKETNQYLEAFKVAFESSGNYKILLLGKNKLDLAFNAMKVQRTYSNLFSLNEITKSISRTMFPKAFDISAFTKPYLSTQKQIQIYQNTIRSIQYPLTSQLLMNKTIENQNLLTQAEAFKNINKLSIINLDHLKNLASVNKSYFEPIAILSNRYESINNLYQLSETILKSFKQNIDYIKQTNKINWINQLDNTLKIVNESNIMIGETHNYFLQANSINSVINITKVFGKEEQEEVIELRTAINKSESIIQDSSGSSILIQKNNAEFILEKLDKVDSKLDKIDSKQAEYSAVFEHFQQLLNPKTFSEFLDEFSSIVSKEYWKQMWRVIGSSFNSSPERIAKSFLGLFLSGRYANFGFVGQEIIAGNGFIDLIVNFFGKNYLVELKVIGASFPITWAKSGLPQLNEYMKRCNIDESYLIVFDGRKTGKGEQLNEQYDYEYGKINVKKIKIYYSNY